MPNFYFPGQPDRIVVDKPKRGRKAAIVQYKKAKAKVGTGRDCVEFEIPSRGKGNALYKSNDCRNVCPWACKLPGKLIRCVFQD